MSGTHDADEGKWPRAASKYTKQRTITVTIDPGPTLKAYSGNADAIAEMMWEHARSWEVREARRDLTRALLAERRPNEEPGPVLLKAVTTSQRGHLGFVASEITIDNAEFLAHGELLCRKMLEAFPQGCLIFDPQWSEEMKGQKRKPAYISKHLDAIKNAATMYFNGGGTLAGCGAKLGNHSIVVIGDVYSYHENGIIHCSMTIGAEKTHPLVGINCWNFAYDPRRPKKIFFHNWLIGRHPIPLMDWFNIKIGSGLMSTMYRTVPYAIQAGVGDLETFLKDNCIHLYRERAGYRAFDTLSPLPIGMKRVTGQKFDAESSQINPAEDYI
ncbi:hypothetical protein JMJ35_003723 [Cladonia borealis]|uniref:Uncharacterized protein n=1 Tax=Cladonia borealis TaxID=184061 RepID=A0AA39UC19_9LECA|nr:hypothetical protein JMJ35_003723 [Cladonia borealis]